MIDILTTVMIAILLTIAAAVQIMIWAGKIAMNVNSTLIISSIYVCLNLIMAFRIEKYKMDIIDYFYFVVFGVLLLYKTIEMMYLRNRKREKIFNEEKRWKKEVFK